MSRVVDVIVLGGGIVGAATAYALTRRDERLRVLLIDQYEPGHDKGSSHGDGRVIRLNYAESIYVEMARQSYPLWDELSAEAGEKLIEKTGLLEYGPAGSPLIQESASQLQLANQPYERLSVQDVKRRFPQYAYADHTDILYQPDGAVIFATKAVQTYWRLFREKGGETITGPKIQIIAVDTDSVTLTDEHGESYTGGKLVVAAGGWSRQIAALLDLDLPIEVTQELLAYFPPKTQEVDHRVGVMPVSVDYHHESPFYSLPIVEVGGVKVGWHHTGPVIEADDERYVPDAVLDGMKQWIGSVFPHLNPEPLEVVTCLYSNSPDFHFVLDKHPQHDHIVIGAGFSGHGFKFGPLLGIVLNRLLFNEASPVPLDAFALARLKDPQTISKRMGA